LKNWRSQVKSYPTIKFIKGSKSIDYEGGRAADEIASFVLKKSSPAHVTLATKEAIEELVKSAKVVVVGFLEAQDAIAAVCVSQNVHVLTLTGG
jgi:protein disulfide-isomerase A1